jgi:hypothetical protein
MNQWPVTKISVQHSLRLGTIQALQNSLMKPISHQLMDTFAIEPFQRRNECHDKSPEVLLARDPVSFNIKLCQIHRFEEQYGIPVFLHVDIFLLALFKSFTCFNFVVERRRADIPHSVDWVSFNLIERYIQCFQRNYLCKGFERCHATDLVVAEVQAQKLLQSLQIFKKPKLVSFNIVL